MELDPADYRVALQRARADLADAEANAAAANVNVPLTSTTSSSQLTAADAALNAAKKRSGIGPRPRAGSAGQLHPCLRRFEAHGATGSERMRSRASSTMPRSRPAPRPRASLDAAISAVASAEGRAAQAAAQAAGAGTVPEQIRLTRAHAGAAYAQVEKISRPALSG